MIYINRRYYTLKQWFEYIAHDVYDDSYDLGINDTTMLRTILEDYYSLTSTALNNEPCGSTYVNILFSKYILPNAKEMKIGYIDSWEIPTATEEQELFKDFTRRLVYAINASYDRYSKLIELYEANKTNLFNELSVESISRYNDTPQEGGLYDDDSHTTNVTQNRTTTNVDILARIKESEEVIRNLYKDWYSEIRRIFLYD